MAREAKEVKVVLVEELTLSQVVQVAKEVVVLLLLLVEQENMKIFLEAVTQVDKI